MGKKRKHSEPEPVVSVKKDDSAPERPQRTLLGWKDKDKNSEAQESESTAFFRNKEKVLVTCSRRINFRCEKSGKTKMNYFFFFLRFLFHYLVENC